MNLTTTATWLKSLLRCLRNSVSKLTLFKDYEDIWVDGIFLSIISLHCKLQSEQVNHNQWLYHYAEENWFVLKVSQDSCENDTYREVRVPRNGLGTWTIVWADALGVRSTCCDSPHVCEKWCSWRFAAILWRHHENLDTADIITSPSVWVWRFWALSS